MGITELLLVAIGLSMDAFAVAICKGLATQELKKRHMHGHIETVTTMKAFLTSQ